jgi:hypothetical protein
MLRRTSKRGLNRFITGVTTVYEPVASFSNKFTAGFDLADWRGTHEIPYGWRFPNQELGQMTRQVAQTITTSFEYTGTFRLQLTPELRSTFSLGAQTVKTREEVVEAIGRDFPGPGEFTVTSTARREGNQSLLPHQQPAHRPQEREDQRAPRALAGGQRGAGLGAPQARARHRALDGGPPPG